MLLPPDPNYKQPSLFSQLGCLSALVLSFLAFNVLFVVFICPSFFESADPNRDARRRIKKLFNEQELSYRDNGKFVDRQSEISTNNRNLQGYYKNSAGDKLERIIATTRSSNLTGNRRKVFLGFIEVIRAERIKKNNLNVAGQKEIQWQYLDIKSFICESDERGVDMPESTMLDRVSDRCPIGYTQAFNKNFRVNIAKLNVNLILQEQQKKYDLNKKFTEDFLKTSGFITIDPEPYQYRVQASGKKIIISAKPKSYKNRLDLTYVTIAIATRIKDKHQRYTYQHCESEIPNVMIPKHLDISKIGLTKDENTFKSCPDGYIQRE
jgi:hypothetical protein